MISQLSLRVEGGLKRKRGQFELRHTCSLTQLFSQPASRAAEVYALEERMRLDDVECTLRQKTRGREGEEVFRDFHSDHMALFFAISSSVLDFASSPLSGNLRGDEAKAWTCSVLRS